VIVRELTPVAFLPGFSPSFIVKKEERMKTP
jgi:hypothetical protein